MLHQPKITYISVGSQTHGYRKYSGRYDNEHDMYNQLFRMMPQSSMSVLA